MGKGIDFRTAKEVSGFQNDVVYIVKGNSFELKDDLKELGARFRKDWGWYFGSWCAKPEALPAGLEMVELRWEEVGNPDGSLKNDDIIKTAVESKIYDEDPSEYVGSIGERIEIDITVESKREFEGAYGPQLCYTMRDEDQNCYTWFTSVGTKTSFEEGESYTIRGTIKEYSLYRNIKRNVLSRVTRR